MTIKEYDSITPFAIAEVFDYLIPKNSFTSPAHFNSV
jgi:hypothetical protein